MYRWENLNTKRLLIGPQWLIGHSTLERGLITLDGLVFAQFLPDVINSLNFSRSLT